MTIIGSDTPSVILHVPHSSRRVPEDVRRELSLDAVALERELDIITDHYTDQLFEAVFRGTVQCRYDASRYVVDPERFEDDEDEVMAKQGMGVIYTRTTGGDVLREAPSAERREELLDRFYRPHHAQLEELVQTSLDAHGHALIIDGHSFPDIPMPCDLDQNPFRPDICIGTDEFHTHPRMVERLREACAREGWSVKVDKPYAGTIVPSRYYREDKRVESVMIEVNRSLYTRDEPRDVGRSEVFEQIVDGVRRLISAASSWRH